MIKPKAPPGSERLKSGPISAGRVKSFVERIERLEEERKAIGSDVRDVYAEAKGVGYDVKTLRWMVQERKVDAADRDERDSLRDTYAHALGLAVDMVRVEGLSLRQAEDATGVSKSSIQRALAVPEVSREMTADDLGPMPSSAPVAASGKEERGVGSAPCDGGVAAACDPASASPSVLAGASASAKIDLDDLAIPAHLDQRKRQGHA